MTIKITLTKTRPSADISWHDPSLDEDWKSAYAANPSVWDDYLLAPEEIIDSSDGLTLTTVAIFQDIESFILASKDSIPNDLRLSQRSYRDANNIRGTLYCLNVDTNTEVTRDQIIAKEREMRAASLLSDDHEYFEVRS